MVNGTFSTFARLDVLEITPGSGHCAHLHLHQRPGRDIYTARWVVVSGEIMWNQHFFMGKSAFLMSGCPIFNLFIDLGKFDHDLTSRPNPGNHG